MEKIKSRLSIPVIRRTIVVGFWLLLWQLLAVYVDNDIILVTPLQTLVTLGKLLGEVSFWQTVGMSLLRIGAGFLGGMIAAFLLAYISSRFALAEELLAPLMILCKTVPVAVFVVLLLLWWGSSVLAVAICFLIVLPNLYISTLIGLKNADKKLLEMASVFGFSGKIRFFYIYRPGLQPFVNSSLKLSLGLCWKSGVAAEVIGTPAFSIGERLYMSKIHLDTAGVFAWAVVIILLSVGFEWLMLKLAEFFWNWEPICVRVSQKDRVNPSHEDVERGLRIKNVCKSYGGQQVLCQVNASYEPNHIYYLTSPSGSGKTTFLRILCGLEQPDGGRVEPKLHYSMVFQEDRLCENYSALRNLELVTGSETQAKDALRALLEEEAWYKPCSQLSGGMKRRVALARAMEAVSDCVLLDEPFTGMDEDTRKKAEAYIRSRQKGRVIIIATHI